MMRIAAYASAVAFLLGFVPAGAAIAQTQPTAGQSYNIIVLAQRSGGRSFGGSSSGGRSFGGSSAGGRSFGGSPGGRSFGGSNVGGPGRSFNSRSGPGSRGNIRNLPGVRTQQHRRATSPAIRSRSGQSHRQRSATPSRRGAVNSRSGTLRNQTILGARTPAQRRANAAARSGLRRHAITNPAFRPYGKRPPQNWAYRGGYRHDRWRHRWYPYAVVGWVGPWFWPYAYYDAFDFFFFSYAFDDFWPYAYDDVYVGIYGPYTYVDSAPAVASAKSGGSSRQARQRQPINICNTQNDDLVALPVEQIAKTVEPTPEQQTLLDALKVANAAAIKILREACPSTLPSTPPGRLASAERRLKAMREAVLVIGPAMEAFYNALNDEQKARFNAVGAPEESEVASRDKSDLTKLCGRKEPDVIGLPIGSVEKSVRPTEAQKAAFDQFKDATEKAAAVLTSDCPTYRALTPTGRIQAMEQRLDAMIKAMETVAPALASFYDGLTDEQKARFNRLEPPRT